MNNSSSWTLYISQLPSGVTILQGFIFLLVLIGNILVLVIFRGIKSLQMQHHFMIGLSVADLITLLPYSTVVYTTANGSILLTSEICDILGMLFIVTIATTSWIHSAMCVEKCVSIIRPISHHKFIKSKDAFCTSLGILTVCFLLPIIVIVTLLRLELISISFKPYVSSCAYDSSLYIYATIGGLFILIPMIVQVVTHILILRVARAKSRLSRGRAGQRINLKVMRTISLTLGLYYCCWLPVTIQILWNSLPGCESPDWIDAVTLNTLVANSGMSFIIYSAHLPLFQRQLKTTFGKWNKLPNRVSN